MPSVDPVMRMVFIPFQRLRWELGQDILCQFFMSGPNALPTEEVN